MFESLRSQGLIEFGRKCGKVKTLCEGEGQMKRSQVCGEELYALVMGELLNGKCREMVEAPESSPGLLWQSNNCKVHLIRFSALLTKEMRPVPVDLCSRSVVITRGNKGWLLAQPPGTGTGTGTGSVLGLWNWAM